MFRLHYFAGEGGGRTQTARPQLDQYPRESEIEPRLATLPDEESWLFPDLEPTDVSNS